jgi:hypothetical protein
MRAWSSPSPYRRGHLDKGRAVLEKLRGTTNVHAGEHPTPGLPCDVSALPSGAVLRPCLSLPAACTQVCDKCAWVHLSPGWGQA